MGKLNFQKMEVIEIGKPEISMLDKQEKKRFYLGLLEVMKRMEKDFVMIAEFHEWQKERNQITSN